LARLGELTRARGVYLIADEVMSGFGRCGEWFAWQRYGRENAPDMMSLAKGLTGAHAPLGAVVVAAPVARLLEEQTLLTGLTYSGHPLSCAAGVAAIESFQRDRLLERSRALGATLPRGLQELKARHAVIGDLRGGHGLFAVVELVRNRDTREPLSPWPQLHLDCDACSRRPWTPGSPSPPAAPHSASAAAGDRRRRLADALSLLGRLLEPLVAQGCGRRDRHELQVDVRDDV
jgi:taurine--2-oxoglutarate transaminase